MTGRVLLPEGRLYKLKPFFAQAVDRAGGEPVTVRWDDPRPDARDFDSLLLCGGVDAHPEAYGEEILSGARLEIDLERDALEFSLIDVFLKLKKPIYGICRGLQMINVALGGSLWQDLPLQLGLRHSHPDKDKVLCHDVVMADGRALCVNSYHHQAVKALGGGLVCAARSPDGIVEAVTHSELPIRAVQWHPERMDDAAFGVLLGL